MENTIAPKKLDYLLGEQAIKLRLYVKNGQPVADFSGLDLNNKQLTIKQIHELQDMLGDAFFYMHWMEKAVLDGAK